MLYNIQNDKEFKANRVEGTRTVEGSIRPNGWSKGLQQVERFRVSGDRTVASKGCNKSNGLGFQATERLTMFNKELTIKVCTVQKIVVHLFTK